MKEVRVGLMGCGGRGVGMAELMEKHEYGRVTAFCDLMPEQAKAAAAKFPSAKLATGREDEFWGSGEFDAVLIATPDHVHVGNVLRAIEAGKHIFAEKPLAITTEDCDTMTRAFAKTKGLVFVTGFCLRFNNLTRQMKEIISSGEIGDVVLAYGVDNVGVGGEYYFHGRASIKKYVCSLLVQKGCHSLDIFNWMIGSRPREVFGYGGLDVYGGEAANDLHCSACEKAKTCADFKALKGKPADPVLGSARDKCAFRREIDVTDNAAAVVSYENGAKLSYLECHFTPEYAREFAFVGTEGRVKGYLPHYSRTGQGAWMEVQMRRSRERRVTDVLLDVWAGHYGGDAGVVDEFLRAVAEGRPSDCGIEAGRESSVLAIEAARSIEEGRPIPILNVDGTSRSVVGRGGARG